MQDFVSQFGMAVAFIGGASAIAGLLFTLYKVVKRIDAAIGIDDEGRTISDRMDRVEYQLWENSGESLKDQVNQIEKHAIQTATEVGFIKQVLLQLLQMPDMQPPEPETPKTRKKKTKAA
jgi:hypothetical protein